MQISQKRTPSFLEFINRNGENFICLIKVKKNNIFLLVCEGKLNFVPLEKINLVNQRLFKAKFLLPHLIFNKRQ